MMKRKVPGYYLPLALVAGVLMAVSASGFIRPGARRPLSEPLAVKADLACQMQIKRIPGYKNIRPLLSTEPICEAPRYANLKIGIEQIVEEWKKDGALLDASVYVRDFRNSNWTAVNGDIQYEPGSILKIPLMMTFMRMAEKDPSIMTRELTLPLGSAPPKNTFFAPKTSALPGQAYSVAELMDLMIRSSDNMASMLLLQHMDGVQMHHTCTDLGLHDYTDGDKSYLVNVKELSMFMKTLYNSTYLSMEDSDRAVSLLLDSEFVLGVKAGLPPGTKVASKFGESGDGVAMQLHETALVYVGKDTYLITVMTKGPKIDALPPVIASIAQYVHGTMVQLLGGGPAS